MDLVLSFVRDFRPKGVLVVLFEIVYTLTDPPLRLLRRYIPPLRAGNIALDLGFLLLFIVIVIVRSVVASQ